MKSGNMSRIGKQSTVIPAGVEVSITGSVISVKGKAGELQRKIHEDVAIVVEGNSVVVTPKNDTHSAQALWGTFSSHVQNMVTGVSTPFEKKLLVEGIGFKVDFNGTKLILNVGFSHPVEIEVPAGVEVAVVKNEITITGADKEAVGQFAADIRLVKKPEPYKGKGIRYSDEIVRRKEGKRASA